MSLASHRIGRAIDNTRSITQPAIEDAKNEPMTVPAEAAWRLAVLTAG